MGETLRPVTTGFNRSLSIETRAQRLTGDPGAVLLREVLDASGIVPWMTERMKDDRRLPDVVHDLPSLLRTMVLLAAQGWRDHDDADALRHDPAMSPDALCRRKDDAFQPQGIPSTKCNTGCQRYPRGDITPRCFPPRAIRPIQFGFSPPPSRSGESCGGCF